MPCGQPPASTGELSVPGGRVPHMAVITNRPRAAEPNDLGRFFVEHANTGDVAGLVARYEPNAVPAFPEGTIATSRPSPRDRGAAP